MILLGSLGWHEEGSYIDYRAAETSDQREERLARCREYMRRRHANIAAEERQSLLQRRREAYDREETIHPRSAVPSFDDPTVIAKMTEFYNHLFSLQSVKCSICQEQFLFITVDANNICT